MFLDETLDNINRNGVRGYFEKYGTSIEVKKETSIYSPRLSDTYVYYLARGIASLTSITREGEEKVFVYFPQDRLLGFAPALMRYYRGRRRETGETEEVPFGIDTKTDCLFYRISERQFADLLENDHKFLSYVTEVVTYNYVEVIRKFHDAQEESARKRFCKWLLTFSSPEDGVRKVPNVFTYVEIAKYLGMHPVTISKLAADLKNKGVIKKEQGQVVILSEERLRKLICSEERPQKIYTQT